MRRFRVKRLIGRTRKGDRLLFRVQGVDLAPPARGKSSLSPFAMQLSSRLCSVAKLWNSASFKEERGFVTAPREAGDAGLFRRAQRVVNRSFYPSSR
jgi:hypothetical protein